MPVLAPCAMAASQCYKAAPAHNEPLGFPGQLAPDWKERALAKIAELREKYVSFRLYLDICVKCGACTDKCHYFLGTGDPKNMPVARQDLMRKIYRRHFTFAGKYFPWLVGARGADQGGARRLVHLFPPVLPVPPLLGLLPVRHRHRRNLHGRPRDHGPHRPGPEILQRDHRQGPQHRQQPRA